VSEQVQCDLSEDQQSARADERKRRCGRVPCSGEASATRYIGGVTTIQDLDGERWPDPPYTDTQLVRRCLALRKKDLGHFTVEDLRIMLGQRMAVPILLPRAVTVLVTTPMAQGDYYPGDLLQVVLQLPDEGWLDVPYARQQLADAIASLISSADVGDPLRSAIRTFAAGSRQH
jgi:hypothetical protein